jgi:hypothetical protein
MSRHPNDIGGNWLSNMCNDVKEYVERCFGVNDIESRYARNAEQYRKARESNPRLPAQNNQSTTQETRFVGNGE